MRRRFENLFCDAFWRILRLGFALVLLPLLLASMLSSVNEAAEERLRPRTETASAIGPLRVSPENPRYFCTPEGREVWLTGSHTWANLHERGVEGETPNFDYEGYLDFLEAHGHNFIRLWAWEQAQWMQFTDADTLVRYKPLRYLRSGPGLALDGKPKFDLAKFNPEYFQRLRRRIEQARERNLYVGVMLFQGFSIEQKLKETTGVNRKKGNPWDGHPFHSRNNINGINGDPNGNGEGEETHTLEVSAMTRLQEAYIRKVIDEVGDLDNILWEISNESHGESSPWQYHLIRFIHEYEEDKPMQHPVGMTGQYERLPENFNDPFFAGPAEWISPRGSQYLKNPPTNEGRKVILVDTDHISPWGHEPDWIWKNFTRGNQFLLMDGYRDVRIGSPKELDSAWEPGRHAMGAARRLGDRVDLGAMTPQNELSTTQYCLANPGREYVVFKPKNETSSFQVQLEAGEYAIEWIDPVTGEATSEKSLRVESVRQEFRPSADGPAVLYVKRQESESDSE